MADTRAISVLCSLSPQIETDLAIHTCEHGKTKNKKKKTAKQNGFTCQHLSGLVFRYLRCGICGEIASTTADLNGTFQDFRFEIFDITNRCLLSSV